MSLKLHPVGLDGYDGPLLAATEFQRALHARGVYNGIFLTNAAKDVSPEARFNRPTTRDGYSWFWAGYFPTHSGELAVLIPWGQDWGKEDDSPSDRAVAVYTRGAVDMSEVETVLHALTVWVEARTQATLPIGSVGN